MEAAAALFILAIFFILPFLLLRVDARARETGGTSAELMRARWEARYHREECAIALEVAKEIKTNTAQRLAAVFADRHYIDYLIARQMGLPNVENVQTTPAEPQRPPVRILCGGQGQTIPAGDYPPHRREYTEYETYTSRKTARHYEPEQVYTPPQQWQARPQIPQPAFRQPLPYDGGGWDDGGDDWADWDDDDVLDVPALPVYPPALLAAPQQGKRKYASDAERQRAYRERKKQKQS